MMKRQPYDLTLLCKWLLFFAALCLIVGLLQERPTTTYQLYAGTGIPTNELYDINWAQFYYNDTPFSPTYEEWLEAKKGKGYNQTGQHTDTENFKQWVKNDKYAAVEANRNLRKVYASKKN